MHFYGIVFIMLKSILSFLWETAKLVIVALIIIVPLRYYVVQPFFVLGASMEPNFENGDYLIIDEISYKFSSPKRGDVVVFKYPFNPKEYYIKRIIGLPGETISFRNGKVFIKNKENPEGFFLDEKEYMLDGKETYGSGEVKLGVDEYFVLGDNRSASSDSRRWGPLKEEFIVGKVLLRVFPFDSAKLYLSK